MTEINCGEIALIRFDSGRIAEIVINPTKPVSAVELVRLLLSHGVTAAKVARMREASAN